MDARHENIVQSLAAQVRDFYKRKAPFRIYHGSTNSTRILEFKRDKMIDASGLNEVLAVDLEARTVVVEPNVAMDKLVDAVLKHGLVPQVVPEFPGITVGGAIQGGAGESSSFRWGFVSSTVNWIEYILADGEIVRTSPTEHADLFYGAAGSMGTLGVIAAAEIRLLPAKRYVRLQYQPVHSFAAATELTLKLSEGDDDFIDGIMFGRDHGVVITGTFSDTKEGRLQRFSRAHDQWFYLHAQDIDARGEPVVETVPLRDYLFRYDRGAFWVGRFAFERFGIPYNRFFRWLLNPLFNTRKLYQALQASAASQEHIVQDLTLPPASAEKFLDFIDEATGIYPLWLCPLKTELRSPLMCSGLKAPLGINVGVWGPRMRDYDEFVRLNRDIEAKVTELGGKKWLYAHTYYTEEEFWKLYDRKWYDRLRRRYHAVSLPDIYEKVRVRERFRVEGRRGALRTISGTAKIRIK